MTAARDYGDLHHLVESAEGPLLIRTTVIVGVCWLLEERPDIEAPSENGER